MYCVLTTSDNLTYVLNLGTHSAWVLLYHERISRTGYVEQGWTVGIRYLL